jgi:hypothetical protein
MPDSIIAGSPAPAKSKEHLVPLWLSVTLEQDYRNLGAFPGLRIESAKRSGTTLLFQVPIDFANEVLEHGRERMRELGGGRGLYQSYRAMVAKLSRELDEVEGVTADPGREAAEAAVAASYARLSMRDAVTNEDGRRGEVVGEFRVYHIAEEDGEYRDAQGRTGYRPGYLVKWCDEHGKLPDDEKHFFCSAADLYSASGEITHLRLVRSN